jgi:hypothetical protein
MRISSQWAGGLCRLCPALVPFVSEEVMNNETWQDYSVKVGCHLRVRGWILLARSHVFAGRQNVDNW